METFKKIFFPNTRIKQILFFLLALAVSPLLLDANKGLYLILALLLHELTHALFAYALGHNVRGIVFIPFLGAYTKIDSPASSPLHSTIIAISAPLINLLLSAIGIWAYIYLAKNHTPVSREYLSFFSIVMALSLFNCVPIFPLDGAHALLTIISPLSSRARSIIYDSAAIISIIVSYLVLKNLIAPIMFAVLYVCFRKRFLLHPFKNTPPVSAQILSFASFALPLAFSFWFFTR